MEDKALIIFVRNPVLGKVKTRIAKSIGDERALLVYIELLKHTCSITKYQSCDKYVFYADDVDENDLWDNAIYKKNLQHGNDLGERMKNAFKILFAKGYQYASIIGSDCYELTTLIIENAFKGLAEKDIVIGPSGDGGYYLLGMRAPLKNLFDDIAWSTGTVFEETRRRINENNKSVYTLPLLNDVDEEKDIAFDY